MFLESAGRQYAQAGNARGRRRPDADPRPDRDRACSACTSTCARRARRRPVAGAARAPTTASTRPRRWPATVRYLQLAKQKLGAPTSRSPATTWASATCSARCRSTARGHPVRAAVLRLDAAEPRGRVAAALRPRRRLLDLPLAGAGGQAADEALPHRPPARWTPGASPAAHAAAQRARRARWRRATACASRRTAKLLAARGDRRRDDRRPTCAKIAEHRRRSRSARPPAARSTSRAATARHRQAVAFQFMLDRLSALSLIDWGRRFDLVAVQVR